MAVGCRFWWIAPAWFDRHPNLVSGFSVLTSCNAVPTQSQEVLDFCTCIAVFVASLSTWKHKGNYLITGLERLFLTKTVWASLLRYILERVLCVMHNLWVSLPLGDLTLTWYFKLMTMIHWFLLWNVKLSEITYILDNLIRMWIWIKTRETVIYLSSSGLKLGSKDSRFQRLLHSTS